MKRPISTIAATLVALVLATGASAVPVETATDLNLRAGPGVRYQIVATMPRGAVVDLAGCDGTWCVVSYRGVRGWASGRYLVRIPFRPAPRGGFLSRLFERSPPAAVAPDFERARPVAPPPARAETPREPARQARRPAEQTPAERSRGTPSPGILSQPTPAVRVPLPEEVEDALQGEQDGAVRNDGPPDTGSAAPAQVDSEAPDADVEATQGAPRRLRREGAGGADVL